MNDEIRRHRPNAFERDAMTFVRDADVSTRNNGSAEVVRDVHEFLKIARDYR